MSAKKIHLKIYKHVSHKLDKMYAKIDSSKLACKSKCSYCCNQAVFVSLDEISVIVNTIINFSDADKANIIAQSDIARKKFKTNLQDYEACSLLKENGDCSIYLNRPFECRRYYSFSVNDCKKFITDRTINVNCDHRVNRISDEIMDKHVLPLYEKHGIFELNEAIYTALTNENWYQILSTKNK